MENDGGLAFPGFHIDDGVTTIYGGMSLRNYFAAAALTGYVMRDTLGTAEFAAKRCYELADAMLREGQP